MIKIRIAEIFTFFDKSDKGFSDTISGTWSQSDGNLRMFIPHCLSSDYCGDDFVGKQPYEVISRDGGLTWTDPEIVRLDRVKAPEEETLVLDLWGPTKAGTELCYGFRQTPVPDGVKQHNQVFRDYLLLIGRKEREDNNFSFREYPSGTFMGEQFMDGGLQLPSGRLVFSLWGAMMHGENWRCGVLLSDDDGRNWRFRTVGYEPTPSIRNKPNIPAGFNEQTLYQTKDGRLVSIIRGREKLGRGVPGSDTDTWFFHSESCDGGESWSKPESTNLPGTGGTSGEGLVLPDGSLLIGCRVPYSRGYYNLPEKDLFGLNLARSFDNGRTWKPEFIIQRDHEGNPFNSHHCAMNGRFLKLSDDEYLYVFGFFGHLYAPKLQRLLAVRIKIKVDFYEIQQTGTSSRTAGTGPFCQYSV
ncbi:MAG: sialidase family protein [Victivallaceae bacterium]|nr:sialidase family protein [Victivallaceae bacterium]